MAFWEGIKRDQGWAIMRSWGGGGCVGEPACIPECKLHSLETRYHCKAVAPSPVLRNRVGAVCAFLRESRKDGEEEWS